MVHEPATKGRALQSLRTSDLITPPECREYLPLLLCSLGWEFQNLMES